MRTIRCCSLALALVASACQTWEPTLHAAADVPTCRGGDCNLEAHLMSGDMLLLTEWSVEGSGTRILSGKGSRYDQRRELVRTGDWSMPLDSVALFTSNDRATVAIAPLAGLTVWSALNGIVAAVCLADPKSCFGSCPTFYTETNGQEVLRAEGFSQSIARGLEATDVDALPGLRPVAGRLTLIMRNEAPETHAVRSVRLLAVRPEGAATALSTPDGRFLLAGEQQAPTTCWSEHGDCLAAVSATDGLEYQSPADGDDLATREEIELEFPATTGASGIVIEARHTLLSTFLFYQTIAWLGRGAGDWLAALERGGPAAAEHAMALARTLGGIDVMIPDGDAWRVVGSYDETGPIASDRKVIPLPIAEGGLVRVRLRLARGHYRIGRAGLVPLLGEAAPRAYDPVRVEGARGVDAAALASLLDPGRYLVTRRGDEYRLTFDLAGADDDELFLESRGYYYEWMRPEWLNEENPAMAMLVFTNPAAALRVMAPLFKERENGMEEAFWASRFRRVEP